MELQPEDFDRSQLFAIRGLLSRQDQADRELEDEIEQAGKMAEQTRGDANEHWVEEWSYYVHSSVYQHAAHSMATVGMIAPFIESAFKRIFRRAGKGWPRKQNVAETIVKYVDELSMKGYMPHDLEMTLQALFEYRNKMFHFGLEWPPEERRRFGKRLHESGWPPDWFEGATTDGEPWMFYMSQSSLTTVQIRRKQVIEGIQKFVLNSNG